jgi:site-specific DNA-adenine methylase
VKQAACAFQRSDKRACTFERIWQGTKDSNRRMPESKSGALTNLATPLLNCVFKCSQFSAILASNEHQTKFFYVCTR